MLAHKAPLREEAGYTVTASYSNAAMDRHIYGLHNGATY
jgi:hypothetical protein